MKHIIKKLLRENLLEEDYDIQSEINGLANDVFKQAITYYVQKTWDNNDTYSIVDKIPNILSKVPKKYTKLKEFISDFKLGFKISGNLSSRGLFANETLKSGAIFLKYPTNSIDESLKKYVLSRKGTPLTQEMAHGVVSDVYFDLFDKNIMSTLIHELQHAYDYWRSKGNYTSLKKSRDYFNKYASKDGSYDEVQYNRYMKLQHEINARFAQAIDKTNFYSRNMEDKSLPRGYKIINDINDVIKDFKDTFYGFELMTPKVKERLLNRVIKMYWEVKEKLELEK